jgi:hypothetical protein
VENALYIMMYVMVHFFFPIPVLYRSLEGGIVHVAKKLLPRIEKKGKVHVNSLFYKRGGKALQNVLQNAQRVSKLPYYHFLLSTFKMSKSRVCKVLLRMRCRIPSVNKGSPVLSHSCP